MEKVYCVVQHEIHFQGSCEALTTYFWAKFDKSEKNRHSGISDSSLSCHEKKENVYLYNRTLEEMDGEKKSYDMWAIRALSKSDSMVGPVKDLSCWLSSLDQMMWS